MKRRLLAPLVLLTALALSACGSDPGGAGADPGGGSARNSDLGSGNDTGNDDDSNGRLATATVTVDSHTYEFEYVFVEEMVHDAAARCDNFGEYYFQVALPLTAIDGAPFEGAEPGRLEVNIWAADAPADDITNTPESQRFTYVSLGVPDGDGSHLFEAGSAGIIKEQSPPVTLTFNGQNASGVQELLYEDWSSDQPTYVIHEADIDIACGG